MAVGPAGREGHCQRTRGARGGRRGQQIAQRRVEAEVFALDVTNPSDWTAAAKFIESRYGKLDILVNNAGVGPADGIIGLRASASTESGLESIFNINVSSLVALTRADCCPC